MATEQKTDTDDKSSSYRSSIHEKSTNKEITIYGSTVIKYHYCSNNNTLRLKGTTGGRGGDIDNNVDKQSPFSSLEILDPEGNKEGNREEESTETNKQAGTSNNADDFDSMLSTKRQCRLVLRRIAYITFMNALIPIVLYMILKRHLPPVWALVLSSTPTIVSVTLQGIFWRRIDTVGIASISVFILSIVLALTNPDPKLLLLRESFITAGAGIICAISLIPIRLFKYEIKPVLYYFGKDIVPLGPIEIPDKQPQPRIRFYWQHSSLFRLHVRIITAIDIILLELEFGLKLFYILTFDIDTVVIASSTTLAATGIFVSVITIAYGAKVLKRLKRLEYSMLQVYAAASQ